MTGGTGGDDIPNTIDDSEWKRRQYVDELAARRAERDYRRGVDSPPPPTGVLPAVRGDHSIPAHTQELAKEKIPWLRQIIANLPSHADRDTPPPAS